jgi:uncharacterized membrane protein
MSQDGKGETSIMSIPFIAGAIGIGIWFLTVASGFLDSGTSPVYALCFFVPVCGVFLIVVVLVEVTKAPSGSNHNQKNGSSGEETSSEIIERGEKNDISLEQFFVILAILCLTLVVFFFILGSGGNLPSL